MNDYQGYQPSVFSEGISQVKKGIAEAIVFLFITCGLVAILGGMICFAFIPWFFKRMKEVYSQDYPPFLIKTLNSYTLKEEITAIWENTDLKEQEIGFDEAKRRLSQDGIPVMEDLEKARTLLKSKKVIKCRMSTYDDLLLEGWTASELSEISTQIRSAEKAVQLHYNYNKNGKIETGKPFDYNPLCDEAMKTMRKTVYVVFPIWFILSWTIFITVQIFR